MENQVVVNPEFLNGWKEIASHMGKGVRTVQRYEELYGLPVRRINGSRGAVIATRNEIDAWSATRGAAKAEVGAELSRFQHISFDSGFAKTRYRATKRDGSCRRWRCFSR